MRSVFKCSAFPELYCKILILLLLLLLFSDPMPVTAPTRLKVGRFFIQQT